MNNRIKISIISLGSIAFGLLVSILFLTPKNELSTIKSIITIISLFVITITAFITALKNNLKQKE